jgi:hypothetical protein
MAKKPGKPRESLVDWVLRGRAEAEAQGKTLPPTKLEKRRSIHKLSAAQVAQHPKYVPLLVWGKLLLGEYAPHRNTLQRWVREGRIHPQPVKIGKYWCVKADAEYLAD